MNRIEFKINGRCDSLLLALVSALSLGLIGCSEQSAPSYKQEAVALTPEQKFAAMLKTAEAGDSAAQNNLGVMYDKGEGVPKDPAKALEWYQKAAAQGQADAQFNLGARYAAGAGVPQDVASAVDWYQKAAAQGQAYAQFNLGEMYAKGDGVTKDAAKAIELFEKASTQGDPSLQLRLSRKYENGDGILKDKVKALEWVQKAAALGYDNAQFALAARYASGEGVPKDIGRATELFEKAATQGHPTPQLLVGMRYARGDGVFRDTAKAIEWYEKAAAQGSNSAQSLLGLMHAKGDGVPKDMVLAYAWMNLAASSGSAIAVQYRNDYEDHISAGEKNEAQRLSSNWKKGQILAREDKSATANISTPGVLSKQGTGTAFIVSKLGQAITNHHVIDGCKEVRVEGREGVAKVSTSDVVNDLALLQVPGVVNTSAAINSDPSKLRQGDDIVVFGFPLNAVLSSGGNLTPGVVSAVTGLGNNSNQIQITAAIQPGSSGSPVLNKKGEVVGVVSMKLSDSKMAKATGSVGQNVNFAVSGQTLKSFLDAHKVEYSTGGLMTFNKSAADLADEAKKWTTVVECWK